MNIEEAIDRFHCRKEKAAKRATAPEEYNAQLIDALYSFIHRTHGPNIVQLLKEDR